MDCDVFIALVVHIDGDSFTLSRGDGGAGELAIDSEQGLRSATQLCVASLVHLQNITPAI